MPRAFGNIVPTGLEVRGRTIYMAEAGPVPHRPEDGKVVAFRPRSTRVTEVASGSPLLIDVEFGRGHQLYALSQGVSVAVAHRRLGPNSSATTSTVERALPCAHVWVR